VTEPMKDTIHKAGHLMGTHQGLRFFRIYLPVLMEYVVENPISPVMADDFVLHQTSCPAGTARVCVVEAAFKLTDSLPLWFLCPQFEMVKDNVNWVQNINANVATFKERAAAQGADVPLLHFV
jgi:hypothetical protein